MILTILTFYDTKAAHYLPPFAVPNVSAAIRELAEEVNNPNTNIPWAKWPEDHELHEIGTFDTGTAEMQTERDASHYQRKQLLLMSTLKR